MAQQLLEAVNQTEEERKEKKRLLAEVAWLSALVGKTSMYNFFNLLDLGANPHQTLCRLFSWSYLLKAFCGNIA